MRNLNASKSPLKVRPLRTPGQSLGEALNDLLFGKLFMWFMFGVLAVVLAAMEWLRWYFRAPPQPVILTVFAVVMCGVAIWRIARLVPTVRQLALGYRGEKVVGQCLEQLRAKGYQVFHDIEGDGHNIDHALVGPGGVFVIETKTISKPAKGESEIVFNGETITVNGLTPDRNPIVQVQAAARELAAIIRETSGADIFVRPVVLYPGWFTRQPKGPPVWVLNENALPKFLDHENGKLSQGEVTRISAGIAMHVRNSERTR